MQVGASDNLLQTDPGADDLLIGSAWSLNPHRMQSTYTTISFLTYKNRYCAYYQGDTCAEALSSLFSVEPTTGQRRVDLLGVSSLMLISQDFPQRRLDHPPSGWRVAARTPNTTLWVREHPSPARARWPGPRRASRSPTSGSPTPVRRSVSTRCPRREGPWSSVSSTGPATPPTWGAWPTRWTATW